MRLLFLTCLAAAAGWTSAQLCVRPVECKSMLEGDPSAFFDASMVCQLKDGSSGVLCSSPTDIANRFGAPAAASPASGGSGIFFPGQTNVKKDVFAVQPLASRFKNQQELLINVALPVVSAVVSEAQKTLQQVDQIVSRLAATGANAAGASSPEQLQLLFSRPQSSEAQGLSRSSLQSVQVLSKLKEQAAVGTKELQFEQPLFNVGGLQDRANFPAFPRGDDKIPGCELPLQPDCTGADKFRRHNGECNSLSEPRLGRAQTSFSRFFPAAYEDGIWKVRSIALNGEPLPSARLVSQRVVRTTLVEDKWRTLSVMQLGQFLNHDMISTAAFTLPNGGGLSCCNRDNSFPAEPLHPLGCNPIPVPADDPFYSNHGRTCMNQVRSLPAPFENCIAGPTGQLNQVSQFLDASNVYGSSEEGSNRLRARFNGLLKSSEGNLLPKQNGRFISGEGRLSENPGLAFMHTIWTREHNRVASKLAGLHPAWDDERLYQEARRIVTGEYQNVIYNEYLPTVLGFKYTREHGLDPEFGHSFSYADIVDPRITSEFSTAAFRFGHAQIPDSFRLVSATGQLKQNLPMEDSFFRADLLEQPDFMAQLARSLTRQKQRAVDSTFSASVHEKLFAGGAPSGLDLIALNINRGRDHGLPSFINVLENCLERTFPIDDWNALSEFFEPDVLQRLQGVYSSIFDIDFYIGGVSEKRVPGALVGKAFQCVIGEQFFATRYGDRHFYDNGDLPNSMTFNQVREIQQSSWARIICDNIENLDSIQPLAFWQPNVFFNSLRRCNSFAIPTVDLSVF